MATEVAPMEKEDDLTMCPICYEVYSQPKSLTSCLHTFCKLCLISYVKTSLTKDTESSLVHCPVCRENVNVGKIENVEKWVDMLPSNHLIMSLIDRNKNIVKKDDLDFCDSCLRDDASVEATDWCSECSDRLCRSCVTFHKKHRLSMDHKIVSLLDVDIKRNSQHGINMFCAQHPSRKYEAYCFDHETPCCLMCATVSHRKCDRVSSLDECAKSAIDREEFFEFESAFIHLRDDCLQRINTLKEENEKFKFQSSKIKSCISDKKQEIIGHLEQKENEILEKLSVIDKEREMDFSDKLYDLETNQAAIQDFVQQIQESDNLTDTELFLESKRYEKEKKFLQQNVMSFDKSCQIYDINLRMENTLETFTRQIKSFGEIELSSKKIHCDFLKETLTFERELVPPGDNITDIEVIDENTVIATCQNTCSAYLIRTDGFLFSTHKLSGKPWAIAKLKHNEVAISIRGVKDAIEILLISFVTGKNPTLSTDKVIPLSVKPYGLAFYDDKFIVASSKRLSLVARDGTVKQYCQAHGSNIFGSHVEKGNILYVDYSNNHKLYCIKSIEDDSWFFDFQHEKMKHPISVTRDPLGNIYVVGVASKNVLQLNPYGVLERQIIGNDVNIRKPCGIRVTYVANSPKLFLSCENKLRIYAFGKDKKETRAMETGVCFQEQNAPPLDKIEQRATALGCKTQGETHASNIAKSATHFSNMTKDVTPCDAVGQSVTLLDRFEQGLRDWVNKGQGTMHLDNVGQSSTTSGNKGHILQQSRTSLPREASGSTQETITFTKRTYKCGQRTVSK